MHKITKNEFYSLLTNLYKYFGREKYPKKERSDLLFDKIFYLKSDIIRKAIDKIMNDLDNLPSNIPKAIKKMVWEIQSQDQNQSQKVFKAHKLGKCEDCKGSGIFKLRTTIDSIVYEPILYCSECDNWRQWVNDPGQRVSKNMLLHMNIMHKPYTTSVNSSTFKNIINEKYDPDNVSEKLKQLADGILMEI